MWKCNNCNEENEDSFDFCWKCNTENSKPSNKQGKAQKVSIKSNENYESIKDKSSESVNNTDFAGSNSPINIDLSGKKNFSTIVKLFAWISLIISILFIVTISINGINNEMAVASILIALVSGFGSFLFFFALSMIIDLQIMILKNSNL